MADGDRYSATVALAGPYRQHTAAWPNFIWREPAGMTPVTHIILTFLANRPVDGLVENHAGYAHRWGYRHAVVDALHVYGERQVTLYKYQSIYQQLQHAQEGSLLLVLDTFSLVYGGQDLHLVAQGYDAIVTAQEPESMLPTPSGMIFRNVPEVREKMRCLILDLAKWATRLSPHHHCIEAELLGAAFGCLPFVDRLSNGYFASVQALWEGGLAVDALPDAMPLVVHNAPRWKRDHDGGFPTADYDFRYVTALLDDAATIARGERPEVAAAWQDAQRNTLEPELHCNAGAPIALVTLYTPNIAGYGLIHDENMVRYCRRHGYAYHAYRSAPHAIPQSVCANWAKLHLIRAHLLQHTFVMWVDADILAINQRLALDDTILQRDFVVGLDHTAWALNSCVVGVRNTPCTRALVDNICDRIEALPDRSSVYSLGGDQEHVQNGLMDFDMLDERHIVDAMTLASSPIYATRESRFVHFPAQHNHYRAATMRVWNRWSYDDAAPE